MRSLEQELISGTIAAVVFQNPENAYAVIRLECEDGSLITVVGTIPVPVAGERLIVTGKWTTHSAYGRQFEAEFLERLLPDSRAEIEAYLSSRAVRGVGPKTAAKIVERFGEDALKVLDAQPERLAEIEGISMKKALEMGASFRKQIGVRRLIEYLAAYRIPADIAVRVYRVYGERSLELLRENPYLLTRPQFGAPFVSADALALEQGMDGADARRVDAAVIFELRHNLNNGHTFLPADKLAAATAALLSLDDGTILASIDRLCELGQADTAQIAGLTAVYLPEYYEAETEIVSRVLHMASIPAQPLANAASLIASVEAEQGIAYSALQQEAVCAAAEQRLLILTGGPGTGKTTTLAGILSVFDRMHRKTLLAAPTGRAAKRMSDLSGCEAVTVHRLLEAKFDDDGERVIFNKNEDDPLECGAVILDEASMVDIVLMAALLRAMPADARLIMVGDADQLPSVGPGNVFSAVIRSQVVPTVRLTEIFRQNEDSRIVRNAHMINRGEHPNFSENTGDFFRLRRFQAASSVETITELCAVRLPGKMKIPPADIQVLTPTRRGEMGTKNLNRVLQEALNPQRADKKEKVFGDYIFREGDRVMQIRNNYDIMWYSADGRSAGSGIYNGDIGTVRSIDMDAETLTVDFDGRLAAYGFESLMELEHAWAMTVHKSQGSEYRAVILALSSSSPMLMTRDVLYTAITRAKELLILVGDDQTAYQMIDNYRQSRRYTALRVRLRRLCGVE